jgi:hypothetical protein
MAMWTFQILLDLLLGTSLVYLLLERRRARLVSEHQKSVKGGTSPLLSASPGSHYSALNEPQVSLASSLAPEVPSQVATGSTLTEKKMESTIRNSSSFESYDRAEECLRKGMPIREISRLTGLSLSEIQLLGKVSNRPQ